MEEKDKSQIERGAIASHGGKLFGLHWQALMTTKNPWETGGTQATFYNFSHHRTRLPLYYF